MKKLSAVLVSALLGAASVFAQTLEVPLDTFTRTNVQGQALAPATNTFLVCNAGTTGTAYVVLNTNVSWITLSINSGTLATSQCSNVVATINTTGLTVGTHSGIITIATTNNPQTQTVTVVVKTIPFQSRGTVVGNGRALEPSSIAVGDQQNLATVTGTNSIELGHGVASGNNVIQWNGIVIFSNGTLNAASLPSTAVIGSGGPGITGMFITAFSHTSTGALFITYVPIVIPTGSVTLGTSAIATNSF